MLSSSGCSDVEQISVCQDFTLGCVQTKRCRNLDGLASCGIIRVVHRKTLEIDQLRTDRSRFFIGPLTPKSPRWKAKTGAALGNSKDNARFYWGIFSFVLGL